MLGRSLKLLPLLALLCLAFTKAPPGTSSGSSTGGSVVSRLFQSWPLIKSQITKSFEKGDGLQDPNGELPTSIPMDIMGKPENLQVQYTMDPYLQKQVKDLIKQYKPDYAAFVAVEPETGKVLALVSETYKKKFKGHVALKATYPAASVFKMVTAAAAIEGSQLHPSSEIAFTGRNHTLYKSNVTSQKVTRWTRNMSMKEAFGRSVNTVFAKIGLFHVGQLSLQKYAERFGFNQSLHFDLPLSEGRAVIPANEWGVAEAASGFTTEIVMSPVQGAMMAAAIVNDGVMMEPYSVQSLTTGEGKVVYEAIPRSLRVVVGKAASEEMKELMNETIERGTSRKFFKPMMKQSRLQEWDLGGKTGSLTGLYPKGKYDWFVGYADFKGKKVAVAALTIHEKYWKVKSAYLARRIFESFIKAQTPVDRHLNLRFASRKH